MIPGHDRLCPVVATDLPQCPQCALIAKVRADEARQAKESAINVAVAGSRLMLAEDIAAALADLRARVEALHPDWLGTPGDVLALIDGGGE